MHLLTWTSVRKPLGLPPNDAGWLIVALVIPPGFGLAQFVLTGAVGTQPYVTTMGIDLSEAGGDFVDVANQCFLVYEDTWLPETSSLLTLDRVTLSVGSDGPGGSVDSTAAPVNGARSGNFPPTALSCIMRKTTAELGRQGRGRMFIPGVLNETEVDQDGTIQGSRVTALTAVATDFVTQLATGVSPISIPMMPVLLHSAGGPAPTNLTGVGISSLVGWIRGRIR